MTSIRDVFTTIGPQGPVSPLLSKYYNLPYNQNLWQGNTFGFTGSTDPARAPYQFNMPIYGFSNLTPRGEGFRPPPAPLAPPPPPPEPGAPEFEDEGGGGDTGGDSAGSETPEDAAAPGNYDFDWGDVAKGALGAAGVLGGPLGLGTISNAVTAVKGINAISDFFGNEVAPPDITQAQLNEWGITPELEAEFGPADPTTNVGVDLGPQVDPDGLKGLGISGVTVDSTNLDAVGFPDLETPTTTLSEEFGWGWDEVDPTDPTGIGDGTVGYDDFEEEQTGGFAQGSLGPDPSTSQDTDSSAESDSGSPGGGVGSGSTASTSSEEGGLGQEAMDDDFGDTDDTGDDGGDDCYVSTALADTGVWSASEKRQAVMWCRRTHHDGSGRGRVWVDGYHGWGLLCAKAARRFPLWRRIVRASTDAFMRLESGEPNPLGYIIKYGWIQPLSYGVGLVKWIVKRHRNAH